MKSVKWTQEELELLKKHYSGKEGIDILSKLLNRGRGAIIAQGKKFKLKRLSFYTKNENFFETPNIINCAISGFLAADGNLMEPKYNCNKQSHGGNVSLSLNVKDINILEKIKKATEYNGKIFIRKTNWNIKNYRNLELPSRSGSSIIAYLKFNSAARWINDLNKNWNITPRKTLTMEAPNITELDHIFS